MNQQNILNAAPSGTKGAKMQFASKLGVSNTEDHSYNCNSNSSLLKNNLYHAPSGVLSSTNPGTSNNLHFGVSGVPVDFKLRHQQQMAERRLHLLSAKTRATPVEYSNLRTEQFAASNDNKRASAVSQSMACVNFANPSKKLATQRGTLNRKDRIFSAITAKHAKKKKNFGVFYNNYHNEPVSESKGESSVNIGNFTSD